MMVEPAEYIERLLNVEIGHDRKVLCPFHEEATRSLHAYPGAERGWYCFGCGAGGNIYDFAGRLWEFERRGPQFRELHDRLVEVFG